MRSPYKNPTEIRDADELICGLEAIIEFWHGKRYPEYGISDDILRTFSLPLPLRKLYAFAGQWTLGGDFNSTNIFDMQDTLLPVEKIERFDNKIVFLHECQWVWQAITECDGEDPPVWIIETLGGRSFQKQEEWVLITKKLSRFLVTFTLQALMQSCQHILGGQKIAEYFQQEKYVMCNFLLQCFFLVNIAPC